MDGIRKELEERGFVKIPRSQFCIDEASLLRLREEVEHLFSGHYETGIYPDEIHWRRGISRENATKEICNGWKANREVAKIVAGEQLGRLACDLMSWNSSRLGQDDVLDKPPQSTAIGFHQDGAYISDNFVPEEENCLTMWIALDDADCENGALQYAAGSHLWPHKAVSDISSSSFHMGDKKDHLTSLREAAFKAGLDPEVVAASVETVCVEAGSLVVHHQRVWHGSGPNQSSHRQRRALVAHVLNGEVQWRTDARPHYIYGRYYIRGESFPREDFFPILFSKTSDKRRTYWLDPP